MDYQTGIDITYSGVQGTDFEIEQLHSDPTVYDGKTVYLTDATSISMAHNSLSSAMGSNHEVVYEDNWATYPGIDDGAQTDGGVICFKLDREMQINVDYAKGTSEVEQYTAPFTLSSLEYEVGVNVVGTTGDNGVTPNSANRDLYYWRGKFDVVGDEWHTLVAFDDDSHFVDTRPGSTEDESSDGALHWLVVNPIAPSIKVEASGDAEFYTTPPQAYFTPYIHGQTTYFKANTGSIAITLKALGGETVYYRINGGSWSSGSSHTLDESDFSDGSNTLDFYYGDIADMKTRKVVKNPGFPSASEDHGYFLFGKSSSEWNSFLARTEREPWATVYNTTFENTNYLQTANWDSRKSGGHGNNPEPVLKHAIKALDQGFSTTANGGTQSYGEYAVQMALENRYRAEPVGAEFDLWAAPVPNHYQRTRGYDDSEYLQKLAAAYDILVGHFRDDQVVGGISSIQDYYLRDCLARFAYTQLLWCGDRNNRTDPAMWGSARSLGAIYVGLVMPSYSSDYYGSSGFDGTTAGKVETPYPDESPTWKDVFLSSSINRDGYPNVKYDVFIEDQWTVDNKYIHNSSYAGNLVNGVVWQNCLWAMTKYIAGFDFQTYFPETYTCFNLGVQEPTLLISDGDGLDINLDLVWMMNEVFPDFQAANLSSIRASGELDPDNFRHYGMSGLVLYNPISNMTNPDLTTTQPQAALDQIKADCDTLNDLGVGTSTITASDLTNALNTTAGEIAVQKTNQDNLNTDNSLGLTLTVPSGDFVDQFQTLYDNNVAIEAVI